MLLSLVLPEIVLGISLFLVFQHLLTFVQLATTAQILGLVTYQLAYPLYRPARLLAMGREY
jgi:spermidine/putrescine transport system permease protein